MPFHSSLSTLTACELTSSQGSPPLSNSDRCCRGPFYASHDSRLTPSRGSPYLDVAALIFVWVPAVNDNKLFDEVGKLAIQNRRHLWRARPGDSVLAAGKS